MKSTFEINGRTVGKGQPCYVIAEAGVNHNCDVQLGYKLIETAAAAGADAIKFQSYTAGKISTRVAPRYWVDAKDPDGTQWDTFDKLDKLSDRDFKALLGHAHHVGVTAFSTPFDDEAVDFLASLDVPAYKIASADLTCHGLIERAARVGRPMILSTGTATLAEVEEGLEVCRRAGNEQVVLLHCTLKYPCPPEGINLRMMQHLMSAFPGVPVGLSDHSLGISVPQAAVALGACMVEKHYTVDKTLPGSPDHHLSVDTPDLAAMDVAPVGMITVASRRGRISLRARADDGTPRGAVFIPFCYYEAAANLLTNPVLDPFGKIPEFKYCSVRVSAGGVESETRGYGRASNSEVSA